MTRKIGITQRTIFLDSRNETLDQLDQALVELLSKKGFTPIPIPNSLTDTSSYISQLNLEGFVFSGGNNSPERDRTECAIIEHAIANKLPILGICHGLQFINTYFGGNLTKITGHVATENEIKFTDSTGHYNVFRVNSFHDYGITSTNLSKELTPLAICTQDNTIEAAKHNAHNIVGVMWHPEREGCPDDLTDTILKDFLNVQ